MIASALLFAATAIASTPSLTVVAQTPDVQQLTAQSDRVVRGEVLTTRTQHETDNAYTVATVRVLETLRGHASPVIDVRMPGASFAKHDLTVHGGARLMVGHEVLLFLTGDRIVNMGGGAFVIKDGAAWRGAAAWTWSDPETLGDHRDEHYVSVDIDEVKRLLR
ncbi:MAG: hypothetical protein VX944_04460 [Myxococcota bacterium]|nr:hypothetical protein [Myxococcota bacterium]